MKIFSQSALMFLLAALMLPATADAGEGKDKGKDNEGAELESITLEGKLISVEKEKKGKDGGVTTQTLYFVQTENGRVYVPPPKAKKGEEPAFDLADFDGANVTISARGYTKTGKDGGKSIHVVAVTDIRRVENAET